MSGPISAPLTVSTVDGTVTGRPISVIKVSNGDLTISGNQAVIDTSGSGGSPGGSTTEIQYNDAGAFGASSLLTWSNNILHLGSVGVNTAGIKSIGAKDMEFTATQTDGSLGASVVVYGGDTTQGILLSPLGSTGSVYIGSDATADGIITARHSGQNLELHTAAAGEVQIQNDTTNQNSILSVVGNGTGTPKAILKNDSMEVDLTCEADGKLYIRDPTSGNRFILDASGAATGITFPDSTVQTTAASGGGVTTIGALTDVSMDITNFTDGLLIQTNSGGLAPSTGVLSAADNNIGIGKNVFSALQSGDNNVAYGNEAMEDATSASYSVAIGHRALKDVTTQTQNTCVGAYSGQGILNGGNNCAFGANVLRTANSGAGNTGCGESALNKASGGNSNSAFGNLALYNVTSASNNTGCGVQAGYNITGASNVCLGFESGNTLTTGSNCVIIGGVEPDSTTDDDQLVISSGDGGFFWVKGDSAGSCFQGDNATTWSQTSDRILKREIVDSVTGLDAINALQVRNFRYVEKAEPIIEIEIDDDGKEHERIVGYDGENRYNLDPEPQRVGVIAQELQEVFPEAVAENAHGHLTVNTDSMNWALIKAVQELSAKVEALEAMIE